MKKKRNGWCCLFSMRSKLLLKMKLLTFVLFVSVVSVTANDGYSQKTKFNMSMENKTVQQIFQEIESKSEFILFYSKESLDINRKVSVYVTDETVNSILDQVLEGTNNYYKIYGRQIAIMSNESPEIPSLPGESVTVTQQKKITGLIKDVKGLPLPGVTVMIKGTAIGTTTDFEGQFSIQVSDPKATLVVSYIGMRPIEFQLNGKDRVDVVMEEDNFSLNEVVVTALGIKRQLKALGYAVSEVSQEEIAAGRESNVMSALSGKVAGVDISTTSAGPSGSTRVIIRGNSQLSGSNLPLYVIDGVPMDNTQLGSAGKWGGYDFGDGLSALNSADIESISVLKGASASALYGSRASNGVVLITTKSAKKEKGLGVEVSLNVNAVTLSSGFNDYQRVYGQGRNGQLTLDAADARSSTQSAWGAKLDPNLTMPIYNGEIKPYGNVNDNILSFFRTGITTTNSIAFSGGNETSDFRLSISDLRNTDIVPESDMARTSFMFKGGSKLGEKIRVEARANYMREKVNNRPALSDSPNNIGNALIGIAPNFDQKWLSTGYKDEFGRYNQWNGNEYRLNPYWIINEMTNTSVKDRVMGHVQLNYDITSFLSFQLKAGTDFYTFRLTEFTPISTPGAANGTMAERSVKVFENNYEGLIRFHKQVGESWDLSAFIGGNLMHYQSETFSNTGTGQVIPGLEAITNYNDFTLENSLYRKKVNSVYGSVNLGYKDFAFVDFTLRNDISSTLSKENRSYMYPSVSGSLVFSQLLKLEKGAFSFGKVRASWANVGGDTEPYRLNLNYGLRSFTFQGNALGEISSTTIPLYNLKPTSTYSYEIGMDLRFFKDRLAIDLGYYNQSTKDQIISLPISRTSGFEYAMVNAGEIVNKGVELSLTGIPVQTRNFEWSSTINLSKNDNEVVKLHPDAVNYELASARWANASIYATEGEPYGVIVGKKFSRAPNGNIIFDRGLPTYDSNLSVLGNGNYDFIIGAGNRFTYKRFSLNVLFDMKWGADLYSMTAMQSHSNGTSKNTLEGRKEWYESEELRRSQNIAVADWTPTGGKTGKGVKNIGTSENPEYVTNDVPVNPQSYWASIYENTPEPYIYDASYVKLRELTFSYSLPSRLFAKTTIQEISVTAYGRNLWILHSNMKNVDPESNYNNGNGQGFEYGSLPSRRTYGLGLNIKF